MALVDDRGRIAGRVNLIDALAAIAIVLVIPLSYGAYLLFRTPPAKLAGVAPTTLYQGPNLRVGINGRNLRPFMRVTFNDVQGRTFMIASTTNAAIDLPDLPPGTYDVVLYDHMEEVDRLKKALTILPLAPQPTIAMVVGGSFLSITATDPVTVGQRFPPDGNPPLAEVLAVGAPVAASLKIHAGEGKWILRRVLDRYVPRPLIDRPKTGFTTPVQSWLQRDNRLQQWRRVPALALKKCPWARRWAFQVAAAA